MLASGYWWSSHFCYSIGFGIGGGILAGAVGMSILINNWNGSGLIQSAVIAAAVSFINTSEYKLYIGFRDWYWSLYPPAHLHIRSDAPCNHEN